MQIQEGEYLTLFKEIKDGTLLMLGVGNIQSYLKWLHICTAEVSFLSA